MRNSIHLPARYYRALPIDNPGHESVVFDLDVSKTAFVGMHCWNIGCPDGPPVDMDYCVGMGWPEATEEAGRIMVEVIRPAMDAARNVGIQVCHMEWDWLDTQYPDMLSRRKKPEDEEAKKLPPERQKLLDRAHGPNYMGHSPLSQMRRAEVVSPIGDEPMFFYSDVFDEYLRERNIDTLIYTGFAADMCLLGHPLCHPSFRMDRRI